MDSKDFRHNRRRHPKQKLRLARSLQKSAFLGGNFWQFWKSQALNAENSCGRREVVEIFTLAQAKNWALKISEIPCYQELLSEFPLPPPTCDASPPTCDVSAPSCDKISKEVICSKGFRRKISAEESEELLGVPCSPHLAVGLATLRATRQPARHGPTPSNKKKPATPSASSISMGT